MSRLYLYAIVEREPAAPLGSGLGDERVTLLAGGGLLAAVGEMSGAPTPTADAVRGHDAVVRRLAESCEAILPARFGTLGEAPALREWLESAGDGLRDALRLVAGREQMTLHVFEAGAATVPGADVVAPEGADALGPGARYLERRRRQARLPELEPLRRRLESLVAAERVEPRATPPLVASVYHLIARGRGAEYRQAVEGCRDLVGGVRLRVSGPLAPYAFAAAPAA